MSIKDLVQKIKGLALSAEKPPYFMTFLIILLLLLAFGLGRLSSLEEETEPVRIEGNSEMLTQKAPLPVPATSIKTQEKGSGEVFASKNGKRYYYANCSGLKRISEANRIAFASKAEAELHGLSLASGCSAL